MDVTDARDILGKVVDGELVVVVDYGYVGVDNKPKYFEVVRMDFNSEDPVVILKLADQPYSSEYTRGQPSY